MDGDKTATSTNRETEIPTGAESCLALVIVWSRDEPGRVGEALLLDHRARAGPVELGRAHDGSLEFVRQRPGVNRPTGPLRSSKLSRKQLRIAVRDDHLEVENTGRGDLRLGEQIVTRGRVREGELLELRRRLILLCTRRPRTLPRAVLTASLRDFPFGHADGFGIVGESPAIWALRAKLQFLAERDLHVLIVGPSGTGKELVARAVHGLSPRAARPLVSRNAATIPDSLVDAELFGNARGYPNPGMRERSGLIGEAHGSSLFLDEIGELPHAMQAHLLRVMDLGEYQRLGETKRRVANLRLLAATNRAEDELKHDFVARFPLRLRTIGLERRREDAPLIARHILRGIRARDPGALAHLEDPGERGIPPLSPALVKRLVRGPHRTHARAVHELLWRGLSSSTGRYIDLGDAPEAPRDTNAAADNASAPEPTRAQLEETLERCGWVMEDTWRALGLRNRYQLRRLLERHDLRPPAHERPARALTRDQVAAALAEADWVKERAWRALGLDNRFQLQRLIKKYRLTRPEPSADDS